MRAEPNGHVEQHAVDLLDRRNGAVKALGWADVQANGNDKHSIDEYGQLDAEKERDLMVRRTRTLKSQN